MMCPPALEQASESIATQQHPPRRDDVLVTATLAVVLAPLLTGWAAGAEYTPDVLGQALGYWLLPAMGLLFVVQQRSVDLSVWMGFGLGATVGATAVNFGCHPVLVLGIVAATGLVVGLVNAAAVVMVRIPGAIATAGTAAACYGVSRVLAGGPTEIRIPEGALAVWSMPNVWILLTGGVFVIAVLAAALAAFTGNRRPSRRLALGGALAGSGILAALGGLCKLAQSGRAPATSLGLIDLRVVCAVILAGGLMLHGLRKGLLAAGLLPLALLASTIWDMLIWDFWELPVTVSLPALCVMVLGTQWVFSSLGRAREPTRIALSGLTVGGIVIVALTGIRVTPSGEQLHVLVSRAALSATGVGIWLSGILATVLVNRRSGPARPTQESQAA